MNFPKRFLKKIIPLLDNIILLPLIFSIPAFYIYARIGGRRLPSCREILKKSGIYPILDHYYQPLFNDNHLKKSLRETRYLPGIDFRENQQLNLLKKLSYGDELLEMRLNENKQDILEFSLENESFSFGDAEFLYQIIRCFKPKIIIEIGSGNSTKIAHSAIRKNFSETNKKSKHICIEPYEIPWLGKIEVELNRCLVENCDLSLFNKLEENDILFIDSSHIIRPQGDVLKEYQEIIPRLNKGVIVHVHDIFTPRDYLDSWIKEDKYFWNEQYLLESMIANNSRYEIIAALNYLKHKHYSSLKKVCPYLQRDREPGSFYFKIK